MKNLKKLLLVFFFTVAVSLFVFAIFASAEEVKYPVDGGYIYFDSETGTITGADNDLTTLDIPAEINGVAVTAIAKNAFKETATDASSERMYEIVNIPASVDTIGLGAFEGCKHIKEFNVSEDNKNFCDIDGLLCSYDKTTLLCYPNAKELGGTCDYYDIPDGITAIETYAFTGTKLDALDLSGITKLSTRAFSGADIYAIIVTGRLERWSASSFHSSTNKYLYYKGDYSGWDAALGYKSTEKYYLGYVQADYPVEGGTIYYDLMTNYIVGCDSNMKVVDIPAEINGKPVNGIYEWAFERHSNLQSVNIPATVKEVGRFAFYECNKLKSITVDDANPYLCDIDGVLFNRDVTEIIAFPTAYTNGSYALPKTVTRIGSGAFVHVSFDVLDISSVTKLGKAAVVSFYINNLYANADVSEYYLTSNSYFERSFMQDEDYFRGSKVHNVYFTGDSVGPWKDILKSFGENYICNFEGNIEKYPLDSGYIFYNSLTGTITGAEGVWNLDIPEEINGTKIVAIADYAFSEYVGYQGAYENYRFGRVTIPGSVKTIGKYAFYRAEINELIINDGVEIIENRAFMANYGSKNLKSLTIPNSVTYIGGYAFAYNNGLTSLTIPGSVKTIEGSAFGECMGLTTLVLEEGIETIGYYAFECTNITELVIPKSVKSVGERAFMLCEELRSVTYYSSTDIHKTAFTDCYMLEDINIIEPEEPTPTVFTDGLAITVRNLDGVKDYFIAKGRYNTYRELKPYQVRRVTENKINGANEYTYTVSEPGEYTVCVRFNDGSENVMLYTTATADLPTIETNALSVNISGLKDLIAVRTAAGVWNTPGEVKRAEGSRNIAARNITGDTYTLYYPESGTYTLTLEYSNGLVVVEHIELNVTEPTLVQDGNSVVIGNLDNLYTIRYAKGEYATMGEIKRAEGCQVRRSRDIKDGVITVTDLEPGTYTFCVQYNDNSYHYFTVVVE